MIDTDSAMLQHINALVSKYVKVLGDAGVVDNPLQRKEMLVLIPYCLSVLFIPRYHAPG